MGWHLLTMLLPITLVLTQLPVAPSSAAAQVFQGHAFALLGAGFPIDLQQTLQSASLPFFAVSVSVSVSASL